MMGTGFAACAEEEVVEPAGYHVYENADDVCHAISLVVALPEEVLI